MIARMSTTDTNTARVREYLEALAGGATGEALARFFTPDARQVELPSRLNPRGAESDLATMLARAERGRAVIERQRFEVRSTTAEADRVAVEAVWTGTLRVPLGSLAAGAEMRAHLAMVFELRDGRVATLRNYDCFEPW